jgi:glycosyltransferase involved in cell wall biosynthesis
MNKQETVSVIIPLYNHEKYIKDAIESVLNQTFPVHEIIIIDDGSTDGSADIIKNYYRNNEKIKYFYQENSGAHNAINRGIKISEGNFVAILNSDDVYKKTKIERCIEILHKYNKDVVFGGVDFIDSEGDLILNGIPVDWYLKGKEFLNRSELFLLSMLNENIIVSTSNMFFRKDIKYNYFYPLRYCHDLAFIQLCENYNNYYYDKENIHLSYRYHNKNTIKEDYKKVLVELAGVTAISLVDANMCLLEESTQKAVFLREFLDRKNISSLVIFLIAIYCKINDKNKFYSYISEVENKNLLCSFIK